MISRRRFLAGSTAASILAACGQTEETEPAEFRQGTWGVPRDDQKSGMLDASRQVDGVLEIFLLGGLNPWDTFYVVPEHGDPAKGGSYSGQQWWTFQDPGDDESIPNIFQRCGGGNRSLLTPFGRDGAGRDVFTGPFTYPLRDRSDVMERLRVMVTRHGVSPHQAAAPLMLGGQPRGSRRLAGTGAHMARFYGERGLVSRSTPYSYVLIPDSKAAADLESEAAGAVGLHQGSARPLTVRLVKDNPLAADLARTTVGSRRAAVDRALDFYAARYGENLRSRHTSELIASRAFADYRFALGAMGQSHALADVFTPDVLAAFGGLACETEVDVDGTGMGLKMAAHLMTSPAHQARYVQVVDPGMKEAFCGGYDTHARHVLYSSRNVVNLFKQLTAIINEPGENDPRKLDLDRHMVLITTEMGRTPYQQAYMDRGLDHWPHGFVVGAIGGPVVGDRAGVVGSIGEDGVAESFITPAELRAGVLMAAGIWPFSPEAFAVGDVRDARTELEAAQILKQRVWGYG